MLRSFSGSASSTSKAGSGSVVPPLRDELLVIGLLVAFSGIVYIDAYYSSFGVKYQLMSFPSSFVIYQGIIAVVAKPAIVMSYIAGFVALHAVQIASERGGLNENFRVAALVLFVPALLIAGYISAVSAGRERAATDMNGFASTLPKVIRMVVNGVGTFNKEDNLRLFIATSDQVMVFSPQPDISSVPLVKRFLRGDIHECGDYSLA